MYIVTLPMHQAGWKLSPTVPVVPPYSHTVRLVNIMPQDVRELTKIVIAIHRPEKVMY